jgi:hypothetical protein
MLSRRGSGVLLHISSLPSPYGIGDLGSGAHAGPPGPGSRGQDEPSRNESGKLDLEADGGTINAFLGEETGADDRNLRKGLNSSPEFREGPET